MNANVTDHKPEATTQTMQMTAVVTTSIFILILAVRLVTE